MVVLNSSGNPGDLAIPSGHGHSELAPSRRRALQTGAVSPTATQAGSSRRHLLPGPEGSGTGRPGAYAFLWSFEPVSQGPQLEVRFRVFSRWENSSYCFKSFSFPQGRGLAEHWF